MGEVLLGPVRAAAGPSRLQPILMGRRSTRRFAPRAVGLAQVERLLWAAQGRTDGGGRTCPSAHALHPLALTVVAGAVEGLEPGLHSYDAERDALHLRVGGDHRDRVAATTFVDGDWLRHAGLLLVLSGAMAEATRHFTDQPPSGARGERYVWLEAGHVSQSVYLQAAEDGLGAVLVAGFHDDRLLAAVGDVLPAGHVPLALFGVGHPAPQNPE